MRMDPTGEQDVIEHAFLCVLFADVISRAEKRTILGRLAVFKATQPCCDSLCVACRVRRSCDVAVTDLLASG